MPEGQLVWMLWDMTNSRYVMADNFVPRIFATKTGAQMSATLLLRINPNRDLYICNTVIAPPQLVYEGGVVTEGTDTMQ